MAIWVGKRVLCRFYRGCLDFSGVSSYIEQTYLTAAEGHALGLGVDKQSGAIYQLHQFSAIYKLVTRGGGGLVSQATPQGVAGSGQLFMNVLWSIHFNN